MRRMVGLVVLIASLLLPQIVAAAPVDATAQTDAEGVGAAVVHAVLFYRPDCPHCHYVLTEVFPPLENTYGDQLRILEIDTATPQGNAIWQAALARYDLTRGNPPQTGVPTLLVGDQNLVGSQEIPARFPALIDQDLAQGGVAWPDLPGLEAAIADQTSGDPAPSQSVWATIRTRYTRDLAGNILSTIVLVALLTTIVAVIRPRDWQVTLAERVGAIGLLVVLLVGISAAGYLTYIETTGSLAVCGPVGDCNAVQQSQYAVLFGFLPVALLGLIGYFAILGGHVYVSWIRGPLTDHVSGLVFAMALVGLAFSTYLTFLEPFVIGATCAWCLTSAVSMLIVTLLTAGSGWQALQRLGLVRTDL